MVTGFDGRVPAAFHPTNGSAQKGNTGETALPLDALKAGIATTGEPCGNIALAVIQYVDAEMTAVEDLIKYAAASMQTDAD